MTCHRTATLSHPGATWDTPGWGGWTLPRHLLRICFLISLEGSSQFCNKETAGQGGLHLGGGGCRGTPPPVLTFWLSESQKVRPK